MRPELGKGDNMVKFIAREYVISEAAQQRIDARSMTRKTMALKREAAAAAAHAVGVAAINRRSQQP